VDYEPGNTGKLASIARPRLFDLGSVGWLRALKLDGYAPRSPRRPQALQDVLVPYLDALRS
jgi:hypothetical protein